ncbi:general stress protein [Paenibacillus darwinianus]|uniref:General stress protein n=1 Tax=Paenibacillus darwinianus TaxID=1380763 RepID=A0A9W5S048_9BACL|nr:Dps family protein [Paenibacillus darwinianus]EXX85923.1 general stress protein [Paenibacillus darwinianus]EXX86040.1 general stress protein [Paenibacillus darwinianus]EXX86152.1 general stress protein [Paenibacillus darwinianus]
MEKIHEALNRQIANWSVLYVKLHHYHWYVTGQQFFTLHAKFQELYEEAALHIDEIAERLLAVQGKPVARMADYLKLSSVKEASGSENAVQMVEAITGDFTTVVGELKKAIPAAQEAGDETTADMLLAIHTSLEKHIWMLRAFVR